ncbi:MAG: ribbon-helix-helix protein, CopG family [Candidatus Binatia bacterium]
MDKVLSVRVDETALDALNRAARRLGLSKKRLVEEAIRLRVGKEELDAANDVWSETAGAWRRRESPGSTVRKARKAFTAATERHRAGRGR